MASLSRLSGALLLRTGSQAYQVGGLKGPCDYEAAGFEDPGELDLSRERWVRLEPIAAHVPSGVRLELEEPPDSEALAAQLSRSLLIERNGSVSQRLWDLVLDQSAPTEGASRDGRWLVAMPAEVWDIVRDVILRC